MDTRLTRKKLVAMIEEEADRTARLSELDIRNVKEPLTLQELDMLDLLLTRADLYGSVPDGHSPEVFGAAIEAANEIYKQTKKQADREQPPANAPTSQGVEGVEQENNLHGGELNDFRKV